jgi:hypothetical protein
MTITNAYAAATTTITTAITYKQLFRVDTIELQTRQVVAVGYGLLNVFIDANAKQPQQSDTLVSYLKEGNWQIPLHKKPPPNMQSLTEGQCYLCYTVCYIVCVVLTQESLADAACDQHVAARSLCKSCLSCCMSTTTAASLLHARIHIVSIIIRATTTTATVGVLLLL